jgi:hypothetical protein
MTEMRDKIARVMWNRLARGHDFADFEKAADAVLALYAPVMKENERLREGLEACREYFVEEGSVPGMVKLIDRSLNPRCSKHGTPFISPGLCPFCDEDARAALSPKQRAYDVCMASDCANTEPHEIGSADCTKSEKQNMEMCDACNGAGDDVHGHICGKCDGAGGYRKSEKQDG